MNSRQRRKLEAIQHNDAIRYEKWLVENTRNQRGKSPKNSILVASILAMTFAPENLKERRVGR